MRVTCAIWFTLLLTGTATPGRAISVATVGDSFADSLYQAMRARPDLMRQYDVQLTRWSRPIIGLTRIDYFDYTKWLRDSSELGTVDVCLAEIGSNDMQSIPVAKNQWIAYGTLPWRDAYAVRTRELARVLLERRCGQLIWMLQPGFEKRDAMACHRELINEVQREAVRLDRTRVMEAVTSEAAYGPDKTHFNRAFVLLLGPALFQTVDTSGRIAHMGCLSCHQNLERVPLGSDILPLRSWQRELAAQVWRPEHAGVQCRVAVQKRAAVRIAKKAVRRRRKANGMGHG